MLERISHETDAKLDYDRQRKLLVEAETNGWELAELLDAYGVTYDSLVYANSDNRQGFGTKPKELCDFRHPQNGIPFVSFFTGCGGMDLGFETAGFEHRAAFEFDERFCKTLRRNRPDWNVFGPPTSSGDVSKVEETIQHLSGMIRPDFEGVFIGGPPCQPFSVAASQRFTKLRGELECVWPTNKLRRRLQGRRDDSAP